MGDNAGAFLGPLLAVFLSSCHVDIRYIFYLAVIPGLLALLMVVLVKERPRGRRRSPKLDISLRQFPRRLLEIPSGDGLFGIGNSSNAFLILRTQEIGASLEARS